MALINCPECGREISDKALSCPTCGCPITTVEIKADKTVESEIKNTNNLFSKTKNVLRKILAIGVSIIVILVIILCIPNGVKKDKNALEKYLLEPDSLIIYQAYTNENYGENGRATLFYFGAENKAGGISDDWALVYDGDVTFESDFDNAKEDGDNKGILDNGEIVFAKFSISMGSEDWKEVNIK